MQKNYSTSDFSILNAVESMLAKKNFINFLPWMMEMCRK